MLHVAAEHMSTYHAAAVMASNSLMAVIDASLVLMELAGIERALARGALESLSRTSLDNAFRHGPAAALTGPVARGDATTVAAHLDALDHAPPSVGALYRSAADHLLELARQRGLSAPRLATVESVLHARKAGEVHGSPSGSRS